MKTTIHPATLIPQLAEKMRNANLDWQHSAEWTKLLKDSLRQLLESEGTNTTQALYSSNALDRHEFLLDLVIWDREDGEGVSLALESEWEQNIEEVATDFRKLLVVKAPLKIMIFACNPKPRKFSQKAVWDKLCECLLLFRDHIKGETYVFMDYSQPPARLAWWIEMTEDGRLTSIPERQFIPFD
jgi:hypothetical protein